MTDEFERKGTVKAPGLAKDAFKKGIDAVPGSETLGEITLEDFSDVDLSHPDSVGEVLVNQGLIDRHQLFNALNRSYSTGASLIDAVIALGYLVEADIERIFGKRKTK